MGPVAAVSTGRITIASIFCARKFSTCPTCLAESFLASTMVRSTSPRALPFFVIASRTKVSHTSSNSAMVTPILTFLSAAAAVEAKPSAAVISAIATLFMDSVLLTDVWSWLQRFRYIYFTIRAPAGAQPGLSTGWCSDREVDVSEPLQPRPDVCEEDGIHEESCNRTDDRGAGLRFHGGGRRQEGQDRRDHGAVRRRVADLRPGCDDEEGQRSRRRRPDHRRRQERLGQAGRAGGELPGA